MPYILRTPKRQSTLLPFFKRYFYLPIMSVEIGLCAVLEMAIYTADFCSEN